MYGLVEWFGEQSAKCLAVAEARQIRASQLDPRARPDRGKRDLKQLLGLGGLDQQPARTTGPTRALPPALNIRPVGSTVRIYRRDRIGHPPFCLVSAGC